MRSQFREVMLEKPSSGTSESLSNQTVMPRPAALTSSYVYCKDGQCQKEKRFKIVFD